MGLISEAEKVCVTVIKTSTKAFFESDEGIALKQQLLAMVASDDYNTTTTYSTQDENGLTFVQKHMNYMSQYADMNRQQYVSNLKLMTKKNS